LLLSELAEDVEAVLLDGTAAGRHGVGRGALLRALRVRRPRAQHHAAHHQPTQQHPQDICDTTQDITYIH
jgi:hypothetical protein